MTEVPQRDLALACLAFLDVEPEAHAAVAVAAGFDNVTLRVTGSGDPVPAEVGRDPARLARLRSVLDDAGLGVLDVEVLRLRPRLTASDVARTVEAAATLGARHLLVVNTALEQGEATDRLGEIVALAAGSGVTPCLEPMLFSRCRTLAEAVATAAPAGARVLLDVLHLFRAGDGPAEVREIARRHGSGIFPYVQVCDALAEGPQDDAALKEEAVHGRLLPGAGDIPLAAILAALPSHLPLAVEAPTNALRASAPATRASEAMNAVRGILAGQHH